MPMTIGDILLPDDNDATFADRLNGLATKIYLANKEKGFYDDTPSQHFDTIRDQFAVHVPEDLRAQQERVYLSNKIMLMVGELSEAHEAIRKDIKQSEHIPEFSAIEEELADTIIRILDFCGYQNILIGQAIEAKLKYNLSRPYKHGKQF